MEIVGSRLKSLREGLGISQNAIAKLAGTTQSTVNRYELGQTSPTVKILRWYADYFDVSLDYIFGRTDNPQGKHFNYEPEALRLKTQSNEEISEFIEMCFDPNSPANAKLRNVLYKMMTEGRYMNGVIYARFSSHNQREESIEGQVRVCKEYAEKNGITVVETYIDRAVSARTADRPDFQRMIADSNSGCFEVVLVYKFNRFSRDQYDTVIYRQILRKNGVQVKSATENISDGPEGILMQAIFDGMNEYYSAELAQKLSVVNTRMLKNVNITVVVNRLDTNLMKNSIILLMKKLHHWYWIFLSVTLMENLHLLLLKIYNQRALKIAGVNC